MYLQIEKVKMNDTFNNSNECRTKYMDTISVMCLLNEFFAPAFLDFLLILKFNFLKLSVSSTNFPKFHDFSRIFQLLSNSMIFPCMEFLFVIFQVFHDFQSLWEPCMSNLPGIIVFQMIFTHF